MNMMKLSEFFPWSDSSDISQQFVTCYDNNSGSGEFAFVYLLLKLLREEHVVELVSCNHDRGHYESILRKNVSSADVLNVSYNLFSHIFIVEPGSEQTRGLWQTKTDIAYAGWIAATCRLCTELCSHVERPSH